MAKIKVRRINREELPGIAILRDAVAADISAFPSNRGVLDLDMEVDPNLRHLISHDPDGLFSAYEGSETLGFAAAMIRSRQCVLSELWVLPQHQGRGAGASLMTRLLLYGDRNGAREFFALAPTESNVQALLLGHEFEAIAPVYLFRLSIDDAAELGASLVRLLRGGEVTSDLLNRRGQADVDRIDRLTRNIVRDVDHQFWLKECGYRAAFVRQGERNAAYAYGGPDQVGPVAGSTQDAALAALGWALQLAIDSGVTGSLELRIPAPFKPAIEAVLETDARLEATMMIWGRGTSLAFDRSIFGRPSVP